MGDNVSWDLLRRKKKTPKEYTSYGVDKIFEEAGRNSRFSQRSEQVQKIEQIMSRISEIEQKMKKGENYFSLHFDLKKQATKFFDLFYELEGKKVFIEESTYRKILETRNKLEARMI